MDGITIVIKCKDDSHVIETIRSIDLLAEIVVALVPNPELKERIKACGAVVVDAPDNNAGASCNRGIAAASNEACILTDSDTVFGKGYIRKCVEGLGDYDLCRGRIRFLEDSKVRGSASVARVRDYFINERHPPYMPGLAVRKSLVTKLRGFDEEIRWGVDHEFGLRAMASGARVAFIEGIHLDHIPVSAEHDLKAALRTGRASGFHDRRNGVVRRGFLNGATKSILTSPFYEPYFPLLRSGGVGSVLHHLAWIQSYQRGYWEVYSPS